MKNHFYMSYAGNKRNECKDLYDMIDFNNCKTFIEPYAGSCAVSYYTWLKNPNLNFILNDENKYLKDMFIILKDEDKIDKFHNDYKELVKDMNKEQYNIICKTDNTVSWFIKNKVYQIRPGLFQMEEKRVKKEINLREYPIYNFFKNANIDFRTGNGVLLLEEYKNNKEAVIFLDPPYINTSNQFYNYNIENVKYSNIYEYLYHNDINFFESCIFGIFEDNWVIRLLFTNKIKHLYDKTYQTSKKKTNHLIISN